MSLYHEAAEILTSASAEGGSLKSRIFNRKPKNVKSTPAQLYALVVESCRWSKILKEVIERVDLLKLERKLSPVLALLLSHDFLLSKGGIALPQSHGLRSCIERHKARLNSEFKLARLRRKIPTVEQLREQVERDSAGEEKNYPRWVRINALKSGIEHELSTTFKGFAQVQNINDVVTKHGKHFLIDPHVPDLVALSPGTDISRTEAYLSGKIIFQDKASCFPAYLLDPGHEHGDIIDACAAPGNKTTHLAAILHGHQPEFETAHQTIYAFEKDHRRAQILDKMVKIAGSKHTTKIGLGQDFLQVDPQNERYRNVGALLLDPSCSGSGIVGRDSMPDLHLPDPHVSGGGAPQQKGPRSSVAQPEKKKRKHQEIGEASGQILVDDDGNETLVKSEKDLQARLEALAAFQFGLLEHAFKFPAAKRITYSTCSIHAEENEGVVIKALHSVLARSRGWRILKRIDQVTGMREWPVRGVLEACGGEQEIADGCIRSYKGDGLGVMGFFVAGFVRDTENEKDEDDDGPYQRDDNGLIIRDVLGMPFRKDTGQAMEMYPREEADAEDENVSAKSDESAQDLSSTPEDDEWNGFDDETV